MMELERQCISLALAQRLKALGVKQEGAFHWSCHKLRESHLDSAWHFIETHENDVFMEDYCVAFTVAELGELLPHGFYSGKYDNSKSEPGWFAESYPPSGGVHGPTEAEACGLLLAALLERGAVRT